MKRRVNGRASISEEFSGVSLGDKRLDRRLLMIAERFSEAPNASFPNLLNGEAELEAMYRFFQNDAVDYEEILAPHAQATAVRCGEQEVVRIAHDTSAFAYTSERDGLGPLGGKHGFNGHFSLALSAGEERAPLGVLAMMTYMCKHHDDKLTMGERSQESHEKPTSEVLSRRWFNLAVRSENLVDRRSSCIHVMDREADDFALFVDLVKNELRFVVRGASTRLTKPKGSGNVEGKLERADAHILRTVPLSPRARSHGSYHARDEREAKLHVRATRVTIGRPAKSRAEVRSFVELNAVQVFEPDPPENEERIAWVLYTTEAIQTAEQIVAVVDHYRARWRIEEFFKALKTGCSMEKRQLTSYEALRRALAVFIPIAWKLLALRSLSRLKDPPPASTLFDELQLDVIRSLATGIKMPKKPTTTDAMLAIAKIGGHIRANGEPGWIVLARGYADFVKAELTWRAALRSVGRKM